jgi:DNA-binding PadR family transcriptional regulator
MAKYRMYTSCINVNSGNNILPWVSLVMSALMCSERSLKIIEVCRDLANGDQAKAESMYNQVYYSLKNLDELGFVICQRSKYYKPTSKGTKVFTSAMDLAVSKSRWNDLSDSKLL